MESGTSSFLQLSSPTAASPNSQHFEMKTSEVKNMDFPEATCVHHFQEGYSVIHRMAQLSEGQSPLIFRTLLLKPGDSFLTQGLCAHHGSPATEPAWPGIQKNRHCSLGIFTSNRTQSMWTRPVQGGRDSQMLPAK
ncbi:hypothetical protein VULLAG_LOCUS5922 [Vulpes lagopus]